MKTLVIGASRRLQRERSGLHPVSAVTPWAGLRPQVATPTGGRRSARPSLDPAPSCPCPAPTPIGPPITV